MSQCNKFWNPAVPYGDTLTIAMLYEDEDGNPIDLTGYHATFTATKDGTTLFQITDTTPSGITLGGTAGTIELFKQMATAAKGKYDIRLTITSSGGIIETIVNGTLHIT